MSRVSFKVTDFEVIKLTREMFETKKAYEYFLIGFYAARELQVLKDAGYIIIDNGEPFDNRYDFHINFDKDGGKLSMPRLGPYRDGGMTMWLGATMGNVPNTVFVYKSELDAFGKITVLPPNVAEQFKVHTLDHYLSLGYNTSTLIKKGL